MDTSTRFTALIVEKTGDGQFVRAIRQRSIADLPPGDLVVRVRYSSLNYKDALSATGHPGVTRQFPHTPGIDAAGEVVSCESGAFAAGDNVIITGYDLGMETDGGWGEFVRIPSEWAVRLPAGLTLREGMALGTAGFTAALSVIRLEERGLRPSNGPVLVTGASGGVGSNAVGILAGRGYEVWAATGKPDEAGRLRTLGAAGVLAREEVTTESARPLESERWAGAVDCVGGATLPYILRTLRRGGTVAASGNTGGPAFATTVFPFILRSVALVGIDSAVVPIAERRATWERMATDLRPNGLGDALTEVTLDTLPDALDAILAGRARGRWIVRIGG